MARRDRRALIAVLLSLVGLAVGLVGAGHVYLREWRRAFAWFALVLGAGLVLTSIFSDPLTVAPESAPLTVVIPILVLVFLSILDAYSLGQRETVDNSDDEAPTCPHCGGAVDPTLDFCHWCTRPLTVETTVDTES